MSDMSTKPAKAPLNQKQIVFRLVAMVVVMGGLSFAAVPLYDWFCRVTGYGGATDVSETAADEILEQTITVRFDASLERDKPWEFKPVVREMEIRIGETGLAFYEAYNPTDRPVAGSQLQRRALRRRRLLHQDRLLLL